MQYLNRWPPGLHNLAGQHKSVFKSKNKAGLNVVIVQALQTINYYDFFLTEGLKSIQFEVINSYFVPKHVQGRPDLSHLCKALFSMYLCKRNMRSCMSSRIQLLCILLWLHSVSDIHENLLETLCLWILDPFLKLCTN